MPHNNSALLSLILLIGLLATITNTYNIAFAQDEDEKEEEETKEEEEQEEEKEESKDEDKEESEDSKDSEEQEEQQPEQEEPTPTSSPEPIVNLTGDQILNILEPVQTTPPVTTITTEAAEPIKEFNATCKCTTINGKPTTKPTTTTTQLQGQEQIPVTKADIQVNKSFGEVVDPIYTNYYTVSNLLDTIINDVSFWSQAGKSSFYIKLDNALDSYQVCSMELNVYQPKNTPFLLDIGVSQNYTGVLDQPTEQIKFEKCVKNMDEIYMIFDNPSGSYVSISEIKLFGSKVGTTQPPTTIIAPQPTLEPKLPPTENATKINIQDSTAEIDIKNSTVTFKFDPLTGIFKGTL